MSNVVRTVPVEVNIWSRRRRVGCVRIAALPGRKAEISWTNDTNKKVLVTRMNYRSVGGKMKPVVFKEKKRLPLQLYPKDTVTIEFGVLML